MSGDEKSSAAEEPSRGPCAWLRAVIGLTMVAGMVGLILLGPWGHEGEPHLVGPGAPQRRPSATPTGLPGPGGGRPTEEKAGGREGGRPAEDLSWAEALRAHADRQAHLRRQSDPFHLIQPNEVPGVPRCKWQLGRVTRNCLVFEETAVFEKTLTPRKGDRLVLASGADFPGNPSPDSSVTLSLTATPAGREPRVIWDIGWQSTDNGPAEWQPASIRLDRYCNAPLTLTFAVTVCRGRLPGDARPVALLADPLIARRNADARNNVLLYCIESTRRDHLSAYGYERRTSPFLEELARDGILFEDAVSDSTVTKNSVPSILTGLHTSGHGALTPLSGLHDSRVTLSEVLRSHGYRTGGFVTTTHIAEPIFNLDQGFDLFKAQGECLGDRINEDILAWLDSEQPEPFFIFVHSFDPHGPYAAPGRLRDCFVQEHDGPLRGASPWAGRNRAWAIGRYDAEILYADAVLGRLAHALAERDLWDQTLVVVTADHGEAFGEHNRWGHGGAPYPETIEVPLVMRLPGGQHGGLRVRGMAGHVDIFPTILGVLGVAGPRRLPGTDLLVQALPTGQTGREHYFPEFFAYIPYMDPEPHTKVVERQAAAVSQDYLYVRTEPLARAGEVREELYDLRTDPGALRDIAGSRPGVLRAYAEMLDAEYGRGNLALAFTGGAEPRTYTGRIECRGRIMSLGTDGTEPEDRFQLSADNTTVTFEFSVGADEDVLRLRASPPNAVISIDLRSEGRHADRVFLGRSKTPCPQLPYRVPSEPCVIDVPPGVGVHYELGAEPGVFIWREGLIHQDVGQEVVPDEDLLKKLRDLGYM